MSSRDLLGDIFRAKEYDVRTFMDVIRDETLRETPTDIGSAIANEPVADVHSTATSVVHTSGFIRIECVTNKDDVAWHVAPLHPKKPWRVNEDRVIYTIMRVMAQTLPNTLKVEVGLPYHDPEGKWDIKEMTFRARGVKKVWNVTSRDLDKMVERLFVALNQLV